MTPLTELASPSVVNAVARIRDQPAAETSLLALSCPRVESTFVTVLLAGQVVVSSGRSVKRSIAELDQLHSNLDRRDRVVVIYDPVDAYSGRPSVVTAPTTSIASPADAADHPWSSAIASLPAGQLIPFESLDAGRRTPRDAGESVMFGPKPQRASPSLTFDEYLFARLRQQLLRLINRMRIALRLRLIYVLSRLSRIPEEINFVLLLLAAARCYGRRTEPSDYTLPVLTSMSVVTGRLPACV